MTDEKFPSNNLRPAKKACKGHRTSLCTFADMAGAFTSGYRNNEWGIYNIKGNIARVSLCPPQSIQHDVCFAINTATSSYIPYVRAQDKYYKAYCCKKVQIRPEQG